MKGALVVSSDANVFDDLRDALSRRGASVIADDEAVFEDDLGRRFTAYRDMTPDLEGWRDASVTVVGPGEPPDLRTATSVIVDCRWEQLFAEVLARIAPEIRHPAWVLDNNDVLWPIAAVDPRRVLL